MTKGLSRKKSIIIVDYRTHEKTKEFIEKTIGKLATDENLIVVDNGCDIDASVKLAHSINAVHVTGATFNVGKLRGKKVVVYTGENVGFARGNNLGARIADLICKPDYYIFTNNDVNAKSIKKIINGLISIMDKNKKIGLIGPKIVDTTGEDISPYVSLNIWTYMIIPFLILPIYRLFKIDKMKMFSRILRNASDGVYYRLSGSFMILEKKAFNECGRFDENTFLYAEEPILSERLRRVGYETYYTRNYSIVHTGGWTTSQYLETKQKFRITFESDYYYYKTYRGINLLESLLCKFGFAMVYYVFLDLRGIIIKVGDKLKKLYYA